MMDRPVVVMNPGTGPVPSALLKQAWKNVRAFRRELAARLGAPRITIKRTPKGDSEGRYAFVLGRGQRTCEIDMPGSALEDVRYQDGMNPWRFPRLYVAGSSWLWTFAQNAAARALWDHDGKIQRAVERADRAAKAEYARQPRCEKCKTVRTRTSVEVAPNHDETRLVCRECEPKIYDSVDSLGFACKKREMPPEAAGTAEDPLCGNSIWGTGSDYCRLKQGHWRENRKCEGYFKIIETGKYVGRR